MKKVLSLLVALLLCTSYALAGTMAPVGEFPVVEGEPETLTILINGDTLVTDFEDNGFTHWIEESCNVNLEFKILPAEDPSGKLQVMISSGEELPDVICSGVSYTGLEAYSKTGAIIPLDDLYDNYSVNLKAAVDEHPELQLLEQVTCSDGHMYAMPKYFEELNNQFLYRLWINTTWLDNLGMDMPTTTEEFYEVLCAFRDEDANGNGDPNDEIPFMGSVGGTWLPTTFIMNSFVYADRNARYLYVEDGQITLSYIQPGWKAGLEYMHMLYEENLLDHASFTQTSTQQKAQTYNEGDVRIVGAFTVQNLAQAQVEKTAEYNGMMPLAGPEGVQYAVNHPSLAEPTWMITKYCKNPELAFRVGDFMYCEEGFLRNRVGVKGESWIDAKEDSVSIFPDLYEATFIWLDNGAMWSNAQNAIWRQQGPLFALNGLNSRANDETISVPSDKNNKTIMKLSEYGPDSKMILGFIPFTEEESKTINELASTLYNYAEENMVLFITGDRDIETEWDAYMDEINAIGVDEFLDVYQTAYERLH